MEQPDIGKIARAILFAALIIVLPGWQWSLFGWVHIFLPLLAFCTLGKFGGYTGKRLLAVSLAIALIAYLLLKSIDLFVIALVPLLSGYVLFLSTERHDSPAQSGLKSALSLAAGWVAVFVILSVESGASAYGLLVKTIDEGIGAAIEYYRQSNDIAADTLVMLEATLLQLKVIIPVILPSIIGSFILVCTWLTMVMGNALLIKTDSGAPWENYRKWHLPERLIWVAIGAGVFALLPIQPFRAIGINSLILLSIIYCFQGLSIAVFFMNKWKVPLLLRSFFYVMIIFQSFGTLLLLLFGLADIWFDFRKLKQETVSQPKK